MSEAEVVEKLPQSLDEADRELVKAARLRQRVSAIDLQLERDISRLRERAEAKKQPLVESEKLLLKGVRTFFSANRDRLIEEHGKKSFTLKRSGWTASWRIATKVTITGKHAPIVAALERGGHNDCVIVTKKPNRRVLGMRPDIVKKIRGLKWDRREVLSIQPPKPKK